MVLSFPRAASYCITVFLAAGLAKAQEPAFRVLLFSKGPAGEGYVHTAAKAALKDSVIAWGKDYGFAVDLGEDAAVMNAANLARYQTVVFNNISAEVVDALPQAGQRTALIEYMKTGGFVGDHAVTEANRWADMVSLVGAKMSNHTSETNLATATLDVDPGAVGHPIVAGMAATGAKMALAGKIALADEWYSFTSNPRSLSGMQILYTLDEKTFTPPGAMGDHPAIWARTMPAGGRIFYTNQGHAGTSFKASFTRGLLINALFWTAKKESAVAIRHLISPPRGVAPAGYSLGLTRNTVTVMMHGGARLEVRSLDGRLSP